MENCLFCKILNGDIPSSKVYEDDKVLAFKDIDPQAPVHVLVIPKSHIESIDTVDETNAAEVAYLLTKIPQIAREMGIDNGYRVVSNVGEDGQQSVNHLHFHILGKRRLTWPPG